MIKRFGYTKASEVFREIYKKGVEQKPGYNDNTMREASYYVGYDEYNKGNLDDALIYFDDCINYSKLLNEDEESGFLINAMIIKAGILRVKNLRREAISLLEEVLDLRDYNGSHERAEEEINLIKEELKSN